MRQRKRLPLLEVTFLAVHVLGIGISLPLLSAYTLSGWPPGLSLRWSHEQVEAADLGFAWNSEALTGAARQASGFSDMMGVGLALAVVVLFLACSTLTVLMLREGWKRRDEFAVRTALGATRRDVRREVTRDWVQLSLVGSFLGAGLGLGLEAWLRTAAPAVLSAPASRYSVFSFVALLAPAFAIATAGAIEASSALRRMKAPFAFDPIGRVLQIGLSAVYVAAVMTLLSASLHLLRGAATVDAATGGPWDESRDTLVIEIDRGSAALVSEAVNKLNQASTDPLNGSASPRWHLASAGAFEDLGVAEPVLATCECSGGLIPSPIARLLAQHHSVSPGVFASLGIPIVEGREFRETDDADAPLVAMIDEEAAGRALNPVGERIRVGPRVGPGTWYEIIGVVSTREGQGVANRHRPIGSLYLSALQHPPAKPQVLVRGGASDPEGAIAALTAVAPNVSVSRATSLGRLWTRVVEPFRWFASLATLLALVTAGIGIAGLTSTIALEVRSRIPEMGVRRAVGARRRHLRGIVLGDLSRILLWGFVLGISASSGLVRGLADRFSSLGAYEPSTPMIVIVVISLAALIGVVGPLRRAGRVTPIDAMGSTD